MAVLQPHAHPPPPFPPTRGNPCSRSVNTALPDLPELWVELGQRGLRVETCQRSNPSFALSWLGYQYRGGDGGGWMGRNPRRELETRSAGLG